MMASGIYDQNHYIIFLDYSWLNKTITSNSCRLPVTSNGSDPLNCSRSGIGFLLPLSPNRAALGINHLLVDELNDAEELVHLFEGDALRLRDKEPDENTHCEAAAGEEDVRSTHCQLKTFYFKPRKN